jgi:hypothetical protein
MKPQKPLRNQELVANIPPLLAAIRYYDDFSDSYLQLDDPHRLEQWKVFFDGSSATIDFRYFDNQDRSAIKGLVRDASGNAFSPHRGMLLL